MICKPEKTKTTQTLEDLSGFIFTTPGIVSKNHSPVDRGVGEGGQLIRLLCDRNV
jgi:hypothetical protein